ncbi:MAG: sodium:proton antiporter [Chloroflexi bacterium]|nr:sodium:proton antiporter [Chloroflexota bacterium]
MPHDNALMTTITLALGFAVIGGFLATKLRLPAIVGYLLAGVALGPFTPGFVADPGIAGQLAELGVILLMFGVGIHFSLRDLLAVRKIAIPGALFQIALATGLTMLTTNLLGWSLGAGLVLGLAVSVASTVVLLRALIERGALESPYGRIAIGWLIVEDLFVVFALVLLPGMSDVLSGKGSGIGGELLASLALVMVKVVVFGAIMAFVGVRVVPWVLGHVARTGTRELFTLSVLALALGVAVGAAAVFDVSLALGAFLAGAAVSDSDLSHQAAADALPLREAFAVLFFVSVGMLFDPSFLLTATAGVVGILALIVIGKGLAALTIVLVFGHPIRTALTVAIGLAQIGEFSFVLSDLGRDLGILPSAAHDLIIAGALLSITLNPLLFKAIDPLERWLADRAWMRALLTRQAGDLGRPARQTELLRNHIVLCGHGRVGGVVGEALRRRGFRYVAIEQDRRIVESLRRQGIPALYGDAANASLLAQARLGDARLLVVAIPDAAAARQIVMHARRVKPGLDIVVRTHSEEEWRYLTAGRADAAILGEREIAIQMASYALRRFGVTALEIANITQGLRRR